jgi:PEP-CTERM motif
MNKTLLSLFVVGLLAASAFAQPSIPNPSFEGVQIGSPFLSANPADIPGWTHGGSPGDALLWHLGYSDGGGTVYVTGAGNQFVTMGGGCCTVPGSASWTTTITGLTGGTTYVLGFMSSAETYYYPQTGTVTVDTTSMNFTPPNNFSPDYWGLWSQYYMDFTAGGPTATLTFSVNNISQDMGLDNVTIRAATPEPGTLVMLGSGLLGALGILRRKYLVR